MADLREKEVSVNQMMRIVRDTIKSRQNKLEKGAPHPTGPLFTFLVGAGFSLSAGVPSTSDLVTAMQTHKKERDKPWKEIFDEIKDGTLKEEDGNYYQLMDEVLPLPPARHDFITAAVQWAAGKSIQMSPESMLLASILLAGTGGNVPLDPRKDKWLPRAFAGQIFTTNFDDVLPTTFYYGNYPVEIIDSPGQFSIPAVPEYPTVVYLHGRHLHYDLRNTPNELKFRPKDAQENVKDLFSEFRRIIEGTGLIVIGYSGAEDWVMECISDALDDSRSLPYGLWWSAYDGTEKLEPHTRQLIEGHDRAYILEPGTPDKPVGANEVLIGLSREISILPTSAQAKWIERAKASQRNIEKFLLEIHAELSEFVSKYDDSIDPYDGVKLEALSEMWNGEPRSIAESCSNQRLSAEAYYCAGKSHYYCYENRMASDLLDTALTRYKKIKDKLGQADTLKALAALMLRQSQLKEAKQYYREALRLHRKIDNDQGQANALSGLAALSLRQNRAEEAEKYSKEALMLCQKIGDGIGQINSLSSLAEIMLRKNRIPEAEQYSKGAINLCQKFDYELGQANALKGLADVFLRKGRTEEAETGYREALRLHLKVDEKWGQANDLKGLAEVFLRQFKLEKAEQFFTKALIQYQEIDIELGQTNALVGLAKTILLQSRYEEVEQLYTDALVLYVREGDEIGQANTLSGLAEFLLLQDRIVEAEQHYIKAMKLYQQTNNELGRAITLRGLGDVFLLHNRLDEAKQHYSEALELQQIVDNELGQANNLKGLADVFLRTNCIRKAEQHFKDALKLCQKLNYKLGQANALKGLAELDLIREAWDKAEQGLADCLKQYRKLKDREGEWETRQLQARLVFKQDGDLDTACEMLKEIRAETKEAGHVLLYRLCGKDMTEYGCPGAPEPEEEKRE